MKVVEIFNSVQGEGSWVGMPVTFIRFFGCNLQCSFCDEPLHSNPKNIQEYSIEEILDKVHYKRVVLTGGEPSLNSLNPLIEALHSKGFLVAVETNGFSYRNIKTADLLTLSPKQKNLRPQGLWDDVKLLVSEETLDLVIEEIKYWKTKPVNIFLSAINKKNSLDKKNNTLVFELALKYEVRVSIQIHKILGVR